MTKKEALLIIKEALDSFKEMNISEEELPLRILNCVEYDVGMVPLGRFHINQKVWDE